MAYLTDHVVFRNAALSKRFASKPIPIDTLFEAYFDGDVDIPGDISLLFRDRHAVTKHQFTPAHVKYFLTKFVPEFAVHSKAYDQKLVRGHYDRGDDFFGAFLGPRMVYTSGFFTDPGQTVEQAQDQKMELVCRKLMLKPGETFLDIGCGWGTLVRYAVEHYGVRATGVTLSKNQAAWGNDQIAKAGMTGRAEILCLDYRDIPTRQFKKIANLEMVEHVGIKHVGAFYRQVYDLLEDQGLFYMQWTGLRRGSSVEDLVWGLFMAKYIFQGADASLPVAPMINYMERSGFEIHSVENVTEHYRITLRRWHDNWMRHQAEIVANYGERWYRIWHVFLAWAATVAGQGTAACFQVVSNKNRNDFDRSIWIGGQPALAERMDLSAVAAKHLPTNGTTVSALD
jgi:cyclopropane fatty-acyl-phospholipid synthase-like methyltransferase